MTVNTTNNNSSTATPATATGTSTATSSPDMTAVLVANKEEIKHLRKQVGEKDKHINELTAAFGEFSKKDFSDIQHRIRRLENGAIVVIVGAVILLAGLVWQNRTNILSTKEPPSPALQSEIKAPQSNSPNDKPSTPAP